jgi:hypothetical protein
MTGKTRRYTLQEMKNRSSGHFFDRATMKFFRGDKYGTRYDSETGDNYIVVTHPDGRRSFQKFHPATGNITYVKAENVPTHVREK